MGRTGDERDGMGWSRCERKAQKASDEGRRKREREREKERDKRE